MLPPHLKILSVNDPPAAMQVDQNGTAPVASDEMKNGGFANILSMQFEDELRLLGMKIKQHEDKIKQLKNQHNKLSEKTLDLQVILGNYHCSSPPKTENEDYSHLRSQEKVNEHILRHQESAAGVICQLKTRHISHAYDLKLTKGVLGIVATLGTVDDENLSRLLSEYLGLDTMLAIVCKNYEDVGALEVYDNDGCINKDAGLHGLGPSIGRALDGRFSVISLEDLRPYAGGFVADDSQRKLDLVKPRLPNGKPPPGFLGFAVNMINVDNSNLYCVTSKGYGLRETLFYKLFSHLQVYRTRAEMAGARSCISEGAVSLDGGIIRSKGVFSLGTREEVNVRFPKSPVTSHLPQKYLEIEKRIKEMNWKREILGEDLKREEALLNNANLTFRRMKDETLGYMINSSSLANQFQAASTSGSK